MGALDYWVLNITPLLQSSTTLERLFTSARIAIFFHNLSNIGQKPLPRQHRLNPKRREVNHDSYEH